MNHSDLDWSVAPKPLNRETGRVQPEETEDEKPKFVTGVDESERDLYEDAEPEVRLISAQWKPGPKGFSYNEQCFLEVKAEYLKETIRAKIRGKLFCTFDGKEEDLAQEVNGFIEKDGTAVMEIEHLWYMNLAHYNACKEDPNTPCSYIIKNITHSRGENIIDSPVLEMPVACKIRADYLEIPDCLFHPDSAVPCIDEDGHLISELVTVTNYAHDFPDKELVLFGHTDQTGSEGYNYELSRLRSCAVKALLDGDETAWAEITKNRSRVKDYQQILKTLSTSHNWPCDPGEVDDINGPKTEEGVKAFQEMFNIKFNENITEDGKIGPQTWKAIFKTIRSFVETEPKKLIAEDTLPEFSYGYNGKGVYPCGESFPMEGTDPKDARNRRVEVVFYDRAQAPELLDHPDEDVMVTREENPVYDTERTERRAIDVVPVSCHSEPFALEFVYPNVMNPDRPHKQYVNLDSNGTNEGRELTIRVRPRGLAQNVDESAVYWKVNAHENNSKRTDPKTGIKPYWTDADLREFNEGEVKCFTKFDDRESSILLVCGVAGGDRFTVEVGSDGKNYPLRLEVENWRKLWYEMVQPEARGSNSISDFTFFNEDRSPGLSSESTNYMKSVLDDCFVEFEPLNVTTYTREDLPSNGDFNIVDGSYIRKDAGKKAVVMTRRQGLDILNKKRKYTDNNRAVSAVWSDYLAIEVEWRQKFDEIFAPGRVHTKPFVFENSLDKGQLSINKIIWHASHWYDMSSSEWKPTEEGDPGCAFNTKREITDKDDIKEHISFLDFRTITIAFPSSKNTFPGKLIPRDSDLCFIHRNHFIGLSIEIEGVGYNLINGAALRGNIHLSTHAGNIHPVGMARTLVHELAHNMGQVYADKQTDARFGRPASKVIPGVPFPKAVPEGYVYGDRGHTGTHCAYGLGVVLRSSPDYSKNRQAGVMRRCIMYGAGNMALSRHFEFCPDCRKHIKAEDLGDVRRSWT
ncbi:peptidoglycan-binding protein [Chitinispirillales bacterium ANBcel5]|uniref:peptidoglycan-binding protein n=1 Tax=Cellulosispirillum alkaliphilum TaxID=3039283 RepID=UPI002A54FEE7|nr:peptidoglycan-binding protein [Chitinispirillales bacterium ANBcel5]